MRKDEKSAFLRAKMRAFKKKIVNFFFAHLLVPSVLVVLHPQTLIGDQKRGFAAMIAERSKMIIYSAKS